MATISINFFYNDECVTCDNFEVEEGMESDIVDFMEENECNSWEIYGWEGEYPDPVDFDNLDEYAEIVDKIDEHGEAYYLRWQDIGDFDFDDQYNGCYDSEAEFAQRLYDDCYGCDNTLYCYVDWDHYARDLMMDYSCYEGSEGLHIFRDWIT